MKFIRTALPYFIASFGLIFTATAMAQYMWLDAAGRKVFSDQPPPANIPAKRILQQPGKATLASPVEKQETASPTETEKTAATPAKTTESKPVATKDKDLEAAKKKIDDEAAAKKKEEQEKMDVAKADNCARAKQAKATLDSGIRIATVNTKGERSYMDQASRSVEAKRIEGIMASDCR